MSSAATKAKKSASAPKKSKASPSHPPFSNMITEAIVSLKERTGSSQYAITKFIEDKHKQLPPYFKKLVLYHLKKLVAAEKLVKVKNSFKVPSTRSAPVNAHVSVKKPAVSKPKAVKPIKKTVAKSNPKTAVKPKAKGGATKTKAVVKRKAADSKTKEKKVVGKPAKVARTSTITSPGKKVVKTNKAVKTRKSVSVKSVKKPKSVLKSPAKKAKK